MCVFTGLRAVVYWLIHGIRSLLNTWTNWLYLSKILMWSGAFLWFGMLDISCLYVFQTCCSLVQIRVSEAKSLGSVVVHPGFSDLWRTMGASAAAGLQAVVARPYIISPTRMFTSTTTISGFNLKVTKQGLTNSSGSFSRQYLCERYPSASSKNCRVVTRAMSGETEKGTAYGLPIDLRGTGLPLSLI